VVEISPGHQVKCIKAEVKI